MTVLAVVYGYLIAAWFGSVAETLVGYLISTSYFWPATFDTLLTLG